MTDTALWKRGQREQLERYCRRDTQELAELVMQKWIRVPGGGGTGDASVLRHVLCGRTETEEDTQRGTNEQSDERPEKRRHTRKEGEPNGGCTAQTRDRQGAGSSSGGATMHTHADTTEGQQHRKRGERATRQEARNKKRGRADEQQENTRHTHAAGEGTTAAADTPTENADTDGNIPKAPADDLGTDQPETETETEVSGTPLSLGRNKRKTNVSTYDQVRRRKKRKTKTQRIESNKRAWGGAYKNEVVIGQATVERIVGGRYDWRDTGAAWKRKRRKHGNGDETDDRGGAQPHR